MSKKARVAILRLLMDRIPNFVPEATILARLRSFSDVEVRETLAELVKTGEVDFRSDPRPETGLSTRFYRPKSFTGLPVRDTIRIGNVDLPRLLSDSQASLFPEVFNESLELVADYARDLEKRFVEIVRRQQRRYWANVASLFGVFISVLSLVIVGLPKITTDPQLPFWDVVRLNLAQVLPIVVVLAIFLFRSGSRNRAFFNLLDA